MEELKMEMKKHIRDEKSGIGYTLQGDYYIPDLKVDETEERPVGIFGQMHGRYLQENKKAVFYTMLVDGTLADYLADVDKQAQEMFRKLVDDMAVKENITEELKEKNMMAWVGKMNNIRTRAREVVYQDLIKY